jgi:PAS domain S-box-containing protein
MPNNNTVKHALSGRRTACQGWWFGTLLAVLAAGGAASAGPKQVMLLYSFGAEFAPFNAFSETFRAELVEQLGDPVAFYDVELGIARFEGIAPEGPLVNYLGALFAARRLDLVVPIGGPAARFAQEHRQQLFPAVPMLITSTDERHLQKATLTTNDTIVAVANDPTRVLESILQVLPKTTNIVVVIGNSPLEKFWLDELHHQFQPFTNRAGLVWFNELSFAEMQRRAAALPPRSVIFYALLFVDVEGLAYVQDHALDRLHAVANAPIFGLHDSQLGRGIVGGPLMGIGELGRNTAKVALRILHGEPAGGIRTPTQVPGRPVYDWRELKRWGISEARLPAGSVIRFRPATAWELYKWRILGNISLCLLEAVLIVVLVANLLKLRRAKQALHQSEERLSLAMAAADLGVWMLDIPRNRAWASANWRLMFGIPPDAAISLETVLQRVHADDRAAWRQTVQRAVEGRADYQSEHRVVLPDGRQRWIAARGRLDSRAGAKKPRLLGVSVDITERKLAEVEVQRQREQLAHVSRVSVMGELAASVAHELNQPLGAILSNAEAAELFLKQDPPALGELGAILADIRKDDERAGEVIRRMRTLLRKHELERQPLEINPVAEDVLRLVSADAALRKIGISAEMAPRLPAIRGDRIHLQQVLLNLILNAMEAMTKQPLERRRLTVRTCRTNDGEVELSVADSGPGIQPDALPRLFEPFFTTKESGIGMGLSISRKIVEAHHGRIWAENHPAGGAVFHVTLPPAVGGTRA